MRHTFYVPVRASQAGPLALRTGRLLTGQRIGLAFTSEASLLLTLGPAQAWVRLDSRAQGPAGPARDRARPGRPAPDRRA